VKWENRHRFIVLNEMYAHDGFVGDLVDINQKYQKLTRMGSVRCRGRPRSHPPTRRPIFSGLSELPPTLWPWEGVWPDRFVKVAWGTRPGGRSRLRGAPGGAPGHLPRPDDLFSKV